MAACLRHWGGHPEKQMQGSLGPVLRQFVRFAAEDKLEEGFLIEPLQSTANPKIALLFIYVLVPLPSS